MGASTLSRRRGNLPADVTSFVGRRRELADLKRLLPVSRLVTLTGVGGVGKTRLALRAASELNRRFTDAAWFVDLAALQDPGLVSPTVASALGVVDRAGGGPLMTLSDFLEPRQVLLVLDNCEHLLEACAVMSDALLRACPGLRILATSRQPLGIAGEHILVVPALPVPAGEDPGSPESLVQYGAVSMFVDRVAAVRPGFDVTVENYLSVSRICQRLDGIPLAIELAAGRLRALSLDELLARLDDRYGVLTGGSPAALPRQQTLRALIDWSFDLCSVPEQLLWARLSVFADGFELLAAEDVCSGGEVPADKVMDALAGLVGKSIVLAEEREGRLRYRLSETLREYGRDRLAEAGLTQVLRVRHRDWCRRLIAQAEAEWFSSDQVELLSHLRREHANLRAALDFCVTESGESEAGLAMASALRPYWRLSGFFNEGRHWLDKLLARETGLSPLRLKALLVDGYLAILMGDFATGELLLEDSRVLAERLSDAPGQAAVTQVWGLSALLQGDPAHAAILFEEALVKDRGLGDQAASAYDAIHLALAVGLIGDDDRAFALVKDSLALVQPRGESWVTSLALFVLGVEACRRGDQHRATQAERRSIRLRLPLDDRRNIGNNVEVLAWSAAADGDSERAARLFGAAQSITQTVDASVAMIGLAPGIHDHYESAARRIRRRSVRPGIPTRSAAWL